MVNALSSTDDVSSDAPLWNETRILQEIESVNDYLAFDIDNFINALDYAEGIPKDHPHSSSTSSIFATEDDYVRANEQQQSHEHYRPTASSSSSTYRTPSILIKSGILRNYSTLNVPTHGTYRNLTIANSKTLALSILYGHLFDSIKDYIEGILSFIISNINALSGHHLYNYDDQHNNYNPSSSTSSSLRTTSPEETIKYYRNYHEQSLLLQLLKLKIWPNLLNNITHIVHSLPIVNVPQMACNKWIQDIFTLQLPLLAHRSQTGTILDSRRMPTIIQKELPSLCSSDWYMQLGMKVYRIGIWMILASIDQEHHLSSYYPRSISLFPDIYNQSINKEIPITTILSTNNYNEYMFIPPEPVPFNPDIYNSKGLPKLPKKGSLGYVHGIICINKYGNIVFEKCKPVWRSIDSSYAIPTEEDRKQDLSALPIREAKESGYGNPGGPGWDAAPIIEIPEEENNIENNEIINDEF